MNISENGVPEFLGPNFTLVFRNDWEPYIEQLKAVFFDNYLSCANASCSLARELVHSTSTQHSSPQSATVTKTGEM